VARFTFWILLGLLVTSAACRIAYGERYRDIVRETLFWWVPGLADWLRHSRSAQSRGRPDL
jgi:hypothetical protein